MIHITSVDLYNFGITNWICFFKLSTYKTFTLNFKYLLRKNVLKVYKIPASFQLQKLYKLVPCNFLTMSQKFLHISYWGYTVYVVTKTV